MTSGSTTTKRVVLAICGGALLAAAVRIWQAVTGSVAEVQAASEVGVGLSVLGVALAVTRLWADARRPGRVFIGATVLAWAALVLMPMWRLGHQPTPVYKGTLGGAEREVVIGPAPETAVYTLEVARPAERIHDDYVLNVRIDDDKRKMRSRFSKEPDVYSLPMKSGQKATLFLEVGDAAAVEVALPTLPWSWVRIAALLLIVLDCALPRVSQPRRRSRRTCRRWCRDGITRGRRSVRRALGFVRQSHARTAQIPINTERTS